MKSVQARVEDVDDLHVKNWVEKYAWKEIEREESSGYTSVVPSNSDESWIKKAVNFRDAMVPPPQSSFRVVALVTYKELNLNHKTLSFVSNKLKYVIGCNAEPSAMEGSICAERSALLQLCALYPKRNFYLDSVYVVTQHPKPKTPGTLCLEFMSALGNPLTRLVCSNGKGETISQYLYLCYPFPSLLKYVPFPTHDSLSQFSQPIITQTKPIMNEWPQVWRKLYTKTLSKTSNDASAIYPLSTCAGILLSNGEMLFGWRYKVIEYGASLSAAVSVLHNLRTTIKDTNLKAVLLMIVDGNGVMHCPNGQTRQLYHTHGLGDCRVVFHYHCGDNPNNWYQFGWSHHWTINNNSGAMDESMRYRVVAKPMRDLIPAPPMDDMLEHSHSQLTSKL